MAAKKTSAKRGPWKMTAKKTAAKRKPFKDRAKKTTTRKPVKRSGATWD